MSRDRYFDFRMPDSMLLWNNSHRGILNPGVYKGFSVVPGTTGWRLSFTHETDPDDTTIKRGVLRTRDGVIVREKDDQTDVCIGSVTAGLPNTHYVVASYTYNESLPNNDVVYAVRQGTSGSPPVPPTLGIDEVLIASIYVPVGATSYADAGVTISNTAKQKLYGVDSVTKLLTGFLDPGIYEGMDLFDGTPDLDVSLRAGKWITKESREIVEGSNQVDLFTLTNPGIGLYRLAWVVGMHTDAETDPAPDVDYLLVEGSPVAIGAAASLPSDGDILTAAAAIDPKYTSATYINKLGYIRVQNVGGVYTKTYMRGETVLDQETRIVYSAQSTALDRSGKYYGHVGLLQAIEDVYALSSIDPNLDRPYTIILDGDFDLADTTLYLPSNLHLCALGAPARVRGDVDPLVKASGWYVAFDAVNNTITVNGTGGGTPPAGTTRVNLTINNLGAYRSGDHLVTHKFCAGDVVHFYDVVLDVAYQGVFSEYNTGIDNWSAYVYMDTQWITDGSPLTLDVMVEKRNIWLDNIEVESLAGVGNGEFQMKYVASPILRNMRFQAYTHAIVRKGTWDDCVFTGAFTVGGATNPARSEQNTYGKLTFLNLATVAFGTNESYCSVKELRLIEESGANITFTLNGFILDVGTIDFVNSGSGSVAHIDCTRSTITSIIGGAAEINNGYLVIGLVNTGTLLFDVSSALVLVMMASATVTNNGAMSNMVLSTDAYSPAIERLQMANDDRNLHPRSAASFTWTLSTTTLEWDGDVLFDLPFTSGYNKVVAASNSLLAADGDRLYLELVRDSAGTDTVALTHISKATSGTIARNPNIVFFATRKDDAIYLWDGTRIEDGQTVRLGTTPPPDGSVTYQKLFGATPGAHTDPLLYWQKMLRDHVIVEDSAGWENDVLFLNNGNIAMSYSAATGELTFASAVDLSAAQAVADAGIPLTIILRNMNWQPGVVGGYTREAIISINNGTDKVTIRAGLDLSAGLGAGSIWNGAIVKGAMAVSNFGTTPVTFSYAPTSGRITWATDRAFSQYQVRPGYVFIDSAGKKYKIIARDTSGLGQWVDIAPGLRDVDTTTPTTRFQGSIETNNNPYNEHLSDLRTLIGAEFIPIDAPGQLDKQVDDSIYRAFNATAVSTTFNNLERRRSVPFDPRVRLWCEPAYQNASTQLVTDIATYSYLGLGPSGIKYVEFTGVCTDVAIVLSGGPTTPGAYSVWVDGEEISTAYLMVAKNCNNTYEMEQSRYEVVPIFRAMHLAVGVHNVRVEVDPADVVVKGLYVINQPIGGSTELATMVDSPGAVVMRGGLLRFPSPYPIEEVPDCSLFNKGGRYVRYIDTAGVKQLAYTPTRSFFDTGNVTLGSPTIASVGDVSKWRVGDIVYIYDASSNNRWLHRITAVGASTLTITPNAGFNSVGVALYYYGHVFQPYTETASNLQRETEEVAVRLNVQEFFAAGTLATNLGGVGDPTVYRDQVGVRVNDLSTGMVGYMSGGFDTTPGGGLKFRVQDAYVRIWFVGTGLSIHRTDTQGATLVYVDGLLVEGMNVHSSEQDSDPGGTFICGELPYGQHFVQLKATDVTPDFTIKDITVWQPKKPTFAGFELAEWNQPGKSEGAIGIIDHQGAGDIHGVDEVQFGTIQYDAGSVAHVATLNNGVFEDVAGVPADAIMARYHDVAGAAVSVNDTIDFAFWGDEITLVLGDSTEGAAGSIQVSLLDADHIFRAPSALAWVLASDGDDIPTDSVSAKRFRYRMYLGFHVLRIKFTNVSDALQFDCIEIHAPVHSYRMKQPVANDHLLPLCCGGIDKRNLSPLDLDIHSKHHPFTMGASLNDSLTATATDIDNQKPFLFYSHGGLVNLRCSTWVSDDTAAGVVVMKVDGAAQGARHNSGTFLSFEAVLNLGPGFHVAWISSTQHDNEILGTQWSATQLSVEQAGISSKMAGGPLFGAGDPNDSML